MSKQLYMVLIVLLCGMSTYGQERVAIKNSALLKEKLRQQAKETETIVAEFSQEKLVSYMKNPQVSKGKFYYQKQDKMRWQQETPNAYVLLINGGKVRIKDKGKEKDIKGANKMMGKINQLMLGLINGEIFEDKEFDSRYFSTRKTNIVVLSPKNKRLKGIFKTIELAFSNKTNRLITLTFYESSGDRSVMRFFNTSYNTVIQSSIFNNL